MKNQTICTGSKPIFALSKIGRSMRIGIWASSTLFEKRNMTKLISFEKFYFKFFPNKEKSSIYYDNS